MSFKLKSKGDLFGYNEELSTFGRPVFEKNLEDGIIAEANRDGTTFVNKNVSAAKKKAAISHEDKHHDQMLQNRLSYDDYTVMWKKDTKSPTRVYKRDQGMLIAMDGSEKGQEGDDFEWEKEANKLS